MSIAIDRGLDTSIVHRQSTATAHSDATPSVASELPDPDGLAEYSVVYTDRSLNHMSKKFRQIMLDISRTLKQVYCAHSVALVPGGGTYGMESVARSFGTNQKCLVLRNGLFSYRWSQIFEAGAIPSEELVLQARPVVGDMTPTPAYAPCPVEEVIETIRHERPKVVFAPHVETSAGIILPDAYMKSVAEAVHGVGGLFVLDCIASGCVWVDMKAIGVDVLISAPQKGWSGQPGAGMVMMSECAREFLDTTRSTCFAIDLKKWVAVMEAYEQGGHMYHATMPTDSISKLRDIQQESELYGFDRLKQRQLALGLAMRRALGARGFKSVAAEGFEAPGVVVLYTDDADKKSGAKFAQYGMQIAAGVPLMVDEFTQSAAFRTFRIGLFGIDKLRQLPRTIERLEEVFDRMDAAEEVSRL